MNAAICLALGGCLGAVAAGAQTIEVTPAKVMSDEAATVRVAGLRAGEHVMLRGELVDGGGHPWASQAEFVADESGAVDTAKQAPVKGSYRIVSAMGLVWSMMPSAKGVHSYRPPPDFGAQAIGFHLLRDGKEVATAQLEESFLGAGVRQIKINGALHGILFLPAGEGPHPGMLVVGGSEGGLPAGRAAWLASRGYAALALAYFHYEGLPNDLAHIPLEYFGQALSWMAKRPEIDPERLGVMGTSRGGELALQLGSMYPVIKAVVAYVPANVRYPSCCGRPFTGAWTWKGAELEYVIPTSRGPVTDSRQVMGATIAVEQTHGPVLVISGDDDGVWPSSYMTSAVMHRLDAAHFAYKHERLNYAHAGHRSGVPEIIPTWNGGLTQRQTGEPVDTGGTPQGNAESSLDAIPKVLSFLSDAFANKPN